MTRPVITVSADAPVDEAIRLMLRHRISGLPVVDAQGKLVGMLTEGDLLRRAETGTERRRPRWLEFLLGPGRLAEDYVRSHGRRVREVMTPAPDTVCELAPLTEIVELMERKGFKRVPVMRGESIVGIVSRANLVQALASLARAQAAQPAGDDTAIRERLLAEIERQPWVPKGTINPIVRDGVVELWGGITDPRMREALLVLAENLPGVKEVHDHLVWIEPISGTVVEPIDARPAGTS